MQGLNVISIHALLAESDRNDGEAVQPVRYFYPRSPCGERLVVSCGCLSFICISIHALLAESDVAARIPGADSSDFYPRSPCGERPGAAVEAARPQPYFYPRSPCGERPDVLGCVVVLVGISIHALLAESDMGAYDPTAWGVEFLSTLSLRRATMRRGLSCQR